MFTNPGDRAGRGAFNPFSTTVLLSGTTQVYTVPPDVYWLWVRLVGPGAGGGGGDQGATTAGAAAGGGAGGYCESVIPVTPGQRFTYTVGLFGAGGIAGNNAGTNGSVATSFDTGGAFAMTGNLGSGGASMLAGTAIAAAVGGAGGTATGGNIMNITGRTGNQGIRNSVTAFRCGEGGSNPLGQGGSYFSSGAGDPGVGYGSGGGGGSCFAATADVAGGNGTSGIIIIMEFGR